MSNDTDHGRGKLRTLPPSVLLRLRLPREHVAALEAERIEPRRVIERLRALDLPAQEATFLGYALPERESVWWGYVCVLHIATDAMPAEQRQALTISERWVRRPDDRKRHEAHGSARAAGPTSAAASVARGVFSARLDDPESMGAGCRIDTAIRRAAASDRPEVTAMRLRRFIASAHEIAGGGAGRLPPEADGQVIA